MEHIENNELDGIDDESITSFLSLYFQQFEYYLTFHITRDEDTLTRFHLMSFYYEPEVILFTFRPIFQLTLTLFHTFRKLELGVTPTTQLLKYNKYLNFVNTVANFHLHFLDTLESLLNHINDKTLTFQITFFPNSQIHLLVKPTGIEYNLPQ